MFDKTGHWLQAGALVVGVFGLYIASRRKDSGQVEQQAPATVPSPDTLSFGTPGTPGPITPSNIIVGGDPITYTYNYPPAESNPVGTTAQQGSSQPFFSMRAAKPAPENPCCDSCDKCPTTQFTPTSLDSNYIETLGAHLGNLFSLPSKGAYSPY